MRVGSYNVHGFRGYGAAAARADLEDPRVWVRVLGALGCDALAIQEAGMDETFLRAVATGLERHLVVLPSPMCWPCALLCSSRPESSIVWSGEAGEDAPFSRAAGAVRLDPGDGEALWMVVIHAHPHDPFLRRREAERLGAELDAMGGLRERIVVLGDFNSEPGAPLHGALRARSFTSALGDDPPPRTRHQDRAEVAVDHLYLSPRLRETLLCARVVTDPGYAWSGGGVAGEGGGRRHDETDWAWSDHLPVVCDLALGERPHRSA